MAAPMYLNRAGSRPCWAAISGSAWYIPATEVSISEFPPEKAWIRLFHRFARAWTSSDEAAPSPIIRKADAPRQSVGKG